LYSISVPENDFSGRNNRYFQENFHPSESRLLICGGLFFLKKNAQKINDEPIKPVRIGWFCRKIFTPKGGMKPVMVVSLFLPAYYADQQDSPQVNDSSFSRRE